MKTIEQIRKEVEAAKVVAVARFAAETGCATFEEFSRHLRKAIPNSSSPSDAMNSAIRSARGK